MTNIKIHLSEW